MTSRQQTYAEGVVYILLAELGWSLSGIFVRFMPGLDGWQINCWRGYWMSVSLLIYLVVVNGPDAFRKFREIPPSVIAISAGFFSLGSTLYVSSLTLASTATVSVIGASSPLFAGLLSPWVTGEKPGLATWGAAVLALLGVGIIAWDGLEGGRLLGIVVSICVPISFAAQTLTLRRFRGYDMVPALCVGGVLTFLAAGFLGFLAGHEHGAFDISPRNVLLLSAMGLVQLAFPAIYYARGARSVSAVTLTLIVMLDAVLNPLWPWIFLGEVPETSAFVGGAIIIGAVIISIFGGRWNTRARN